MDKHVYNNTVPVHIWQKVEATQMMNSKQNVLYTHPEILYSHERNEILIDTTWMKPKNIRQNERCQTRKAICCFFPFM